MRRRTNAFSRTASIWTSAVLAALLGGCGGPSGPPRQPVVGMLTFNGKAVPDAQVAFQCPEQNVYFTAMTDPQGRFEVVAASGDGLPAGTYQITVYPAPSDDEEITEVPQRPDIPQRYRSTSTSDLKLTVAEGDNDFALEMTGP